MYLWEEEGKKKKHRCFRAKLKTIPTHDKGNCYRLGSHYFMMPWPLKCTGSKHALVFFTLNWKKKKKTLKSDVTPHSQVTKTDLLGMPI